MFCWQLKIKYKMRRYLEILLITLGLRRQNLRWGTVYDSKTKQPLDPVILKMIDVGSGKVVQTGITDLKGRYGFLALPGFYKILAKKSNYFFPSNLVRSKNDGMHTNLYHGEFFELKGGTEVVSFNIPMDPLYFDWNQEAKMRFVKSYPFFENMFSILIPLFFWFFLFYEFYLFFKNSNKLSGYILGVYLLIFLIAIFFPKSRLWGRVLDSNTKRALANVTIELCLAQNPSIKLARVNTIEDGKYFLKSEPGNYKLRIIDKFDNELKAADIRVDKGSIYNKDIWV
jgi:hypothetical protein